MFLGIQKNSRGAEGKNKKTPDPFSDVRVLVDTGATYTTLPRDVLDALDCQPIGTRRVLLANLLSYRPERGSGLSGRGHVGRAGTGSRPGRKKTGASAKLSHQHPMTLSLVPFPFLKPLPGCRFRLQREKDNFAVPFFCCRSFGN